MVYRCYNCSKPLDDKPNCLCDDCLVKWRKEMRERESIIPGGLSCPPLIENRMKGTSGENRKARIARGQCGKHVIRKSEPMGG